jgi:hypothetical protein
LLWIKESSLNTLNVNDDTWSLRRTGSTQGSWSSLLPLAVGDGDLPVGSVGVKCKMCLKTLLLNLLNPFPLNDGYVTLSKAFVFAAFKL